MLPQKIFVMAVLTFLCLPSQGFPSECDKSESDRPSEARFVVVAGPDLEIIRDRVIADLLEPALNEELIKTLIKSIKQDGSWPDIDYVDVSRTGFQHSRH